MTRQEITLTLDQFIGAVARLDGDDQVALMESLGFESASAGLDEWSGTFAEEWGITPADLRRQVSLTLDSHGNIDNESCPVWAD